jgi:hypothetical protein
MERNVLQYMPLLFKNGLKSGRIVRRCAAAESVDFIALF